MHASATASVMPRSGPETGWKRVDRKRWEITSLPRAADARFGPG